MIFIKNIAFKIALPLGILFTFQLIGNLINKYLISFLPGPVIGMLLLLVALTLKIVPYKFMEEFTTFLIKHISFFLIPTSVSLIIILPLIKDYFIRIMIMLVLSLISVFIISARFSNWYSKKRNVRNIDE